ncbi:class A beta-lactamase-related serine hydrolase [Sphingomonas sp. UV9]|nr:class A beta-lactamase-related serine hydrolase [Sphingomonas sp. UV9]
MLAALTGDIAAAQLPALRSDRAPASPLATARPLLAHDLTKLDADAWLEGFMPYALRTGDIAGAVVVIVKDGAVLTQRGFGLADLKSRTLVDPDRTLFRSGSVGKLFTWTAVMQQVEAGRIDLDADINTYLDFKIPLFEGRPITMRQIMTHTAGFEERNKDLITSDKSRLTSIERYLKSWTPRRIYAPGTTPAYSNYAAALAGYIVQRVSGVPFDRYVEQRIFQPLDMRHSTFRQPVPASLNALMATGYPRASEEPGKFEYASAAPAGSLSLSGADMGRFMIAHLNGGAGLMRADTARTMHDTPTTILPHVNRMELGFFETNMNGRQIIGHLGDTALFHGAVHLFMNEGVGLYIAMNSTGRNGASTPLRLGLFEDFANRYFPSLRPEELQGVDAKTAAEHARMMVGQWRSSRRSEAGVMRMVGVLGQITVSTNARGELVVNVLRTPGGAPRTWVEVSPFLWREKYGHERLSAKVENGRIVRWSSDFFSPFMVFDRVPAKASATWVLPAFYAALSVLLLTLLQWPAAALVRRRYKASLPLTGRARATYHGIRATAGLALGVMVSWMLILSDPMNISDTALWLVQVVGAIVFAVLAALAVSNLLFAFRQRRSWPDKAAAVVIVLAVGMVAYVATTFGLVDMTVHY